MMEPELETGKVYQVNHKRKGNFNLLITNEYQAYVTGLITSGIALAIDIKQAGEMITIRKSLCIFIPL